VVPLIAATKEVSRMQRSVLIIIAIFVVLAIVALAVSFMQGSGVEREVQNPGAVEAQPTLR
jgi:flagellar basal body-associated protein FliL